MHYVQRDVTVDAQRVVSVGPDQVAGISQPALVRCELEDGRFVELHAGHTGFAPVKIGDYVTSDDQHFLKNEFEAKYVSY